MWGQVPHGVLVPQTDGTYRLRDSLTKLLRTWLADKGSLVHVIDTERRSMKVKDKMEHVLYITVESVTWVLFCSTAFHVNVYVF